MNLNSSYKKFEPYTYKSLKDLKKKIENLRLKIPIIEKVEILRQGLKI